jgi:hypothetical protein
MAGEREGKIECWNFEKEGNICAGKNLWHMYEYPCMENDITWKVGGVTYGEHHRICLGERER